MLNYICVYKNGTSALTHSLTKCVAFQANVKAYCAWDSLTKAKAKAKAKT